MQFCDGLTKNWPENAIHLWSARMADGPNEVRAALLEVGKCHPRAIAGRIVVQQHQKMRRAAHLPVAIGWRVG